MRAYIIRRLLLLIPTLFFLTIDAIDRDRRRLFRGRLRDFDTREALIRALGLDAPLHVQYVRWVDGIVLHGTLGTSLYGSAFTIEEQILRRLAIWPGLCLTIVVYGFNMFGDAIRDLLDPRLRGGGGRYGTSKRSKTVPRSAR